MNLLKYYFVQDNMVLSFNENNGSFNYLIVKNVVYKYFSSLIENKR
jgi:hypothetical protein